MERIVGISDINYAKHLDSVAMLKILHEARLQFLASLGFTEANIYGLGMVVTDLAVDYRSESFANDLLIIDVGVGTAHRIENTGTEDLVFVEVQLGSYFGEDDIKRLEDDYGRA
ncbi:MAG: hypothetical protein IIC60_11465 [Proteobacteria bacterium]|nr:hypothetical protein [Pseudomonadota bacterium]